MPVLVGISILWSKRRRVSSQPFNGSYRCWRRSMSCRNISWLYSSGWPKTAKPLWKQINWDFLRPVGKSSRKSREAKKCKLKNGLFMTWITPSTKNMTPPIYSLEDDYFNIHFFWSSWWTRSRQACRIKGQLRKQQVSWILLRSCWGINFIKLTDSCKGVQPVRLPGPSPRPVRCNQSKVIGRLLRFSWLKRCEGRFFLGSNAALDIRMSKRPSNRWQPESKSEAKLQKMARGIQVFTGWWFQIFFIFAPIWGRFPFWLVFFNWVETTNQFRCASFFLVLDWDYT